MFTRILVPTDFSAPSDVALEYARVMARQFGAALHVLHVVEDSSLEDGFLPDALIPSSPESRTARLREALERLSHRITAEDREQLRAKSEVIFGKPSHAIIDYASDNGFDLIVMGTHGREGIAHLLMGSVAELVVRSATCPVMTLHEGHARTPIAVRIAEGLRAAAV
jgi:nucleotide-binding universal stress UspA family protein